MNSKKMRSWLVLLALVVCGTLLAQVPDAMTFQSVIRDVTGELATNRAITLQVSILQGSATGEAVYVENLSGKTNANGLISLNIGRGTPVIGTFAEIDWSNGPYFLQVGVDVNGGFDFTTQSTTQLLSVPYALHARSAETFSGTLSYHQLTDVPEGSGFSGAYADLTGKPELAAVATSGQYADLQGTPSLAAVAESGAYTDLSGKPALANVATTGAYADLTGKPALAKVATSGAYADLSGTPTLAHVATTGSYEDLTDKPALSADGTFTGSYNDLSSKPNFADSIAKYGFDGDYNNLTNKPSWATVALSGSYNDLTDKPTSIGGGGVTDYNALSNLPNLKDSVEKYSASAVMDYAALRNQPSFADSVAKYQNRDYYNLTSRPNIRDSVAALTFSGDYNDLVNRPKIQDSIAEFGFSGKWHDLQDMPQGIQTGAIMIYDSNSKSWRTLEPGKAGDILMIGSNGSPIWISASLMAQNIANVEMLDIVIKDYPNEKFTATESSGLMSPSGKLKVPMYQDVSYKFEPASGWGVKQVLLNGRDSTDLYYTEKGSTYLEFAVDTTGTGFDSYEIDLVLATEDVTYIRRFETETDKYTCDTTTIAVGYNCDFVADIAHEDGYGLYSITVDDKDRTATARSVDKIVVRNITTPTKVVATYNKGLFSLGDIYVENDVAVGVVFDIADNGSTATVISIAQAKAQDAYTWAEAVSHAAAAGDGWHLPSVKELKALYNASEIIYPILNSQGVENSLENAELWTSAEENDEFALSFNMKQGYTSGLPKTREFVTVAVKAITKQ